MRVALVTDGIWPYVLGGMQKHSYYLCKYMAQQGVAVDLFHFNNSELDVEDLDVFSQEEKKFIRSFIVPFPKGPSFPGHYLFKSYHHSKLVYQKLLPELDRYSFIYTKGLAGWYLINKKSRGAIRCAPIGVKFHGYEMFQRAPNLKIFLQQVFLLRHPVRSLSKKADMVFSYGGKITTIIKEIGVPVGKIVELPSGVEKEIIADEITPTGHQKKILYLGRYERRKGIEELNAAITNGKFDHNKVEFRFIGPIPDSRKLDAQCVRYYGEVRDKNKLNALVRECDVLICPSWSEGMPNVILEAMANGLAVAATDVGATGVLVDENCGWIIDSANGEAILWTLRNIIESPGQAIDSKKKNALAKIKQRFTWDKLISELIGRITT